MFDTLRLARADPSVKHQVVGRIRDVDGRVRIYGGSVAFLEATYAWVSADSGGFRVYAHRAQVEHDVWQGLRPGQSVQFAVGFNYFGPSASGLKIA